MSTIPLRNQAGSLGEEVSRADVLHHIVEQAYLNSGSWRWSRSRDGSHRPAQAVVGLDHCHPSYDALVVTWEAKNVAIGKVKWFDAQKGYGFIERPGEKDVFVHYSTIQEQGYKSLTDGEDVEYELVETDRGPQAHKVQRLHKPAAVEQEAPQGV